MKSAKSWEEKAGAYFAQHALLFVSNLLVEHALFSILGSPRL
jgi:hypothetical protein